jgi:purine nucleoside phosphorylase
VITTNAVGALNPRLRVGEIVAVTDVIELTMGRYRGRGQELFAPDMGRTSGCVGFDPDWRCQTIELAARRGASVSQGVYASVHGPSYETRAEVRMLGRLGGDVVGMSAAPELAAATYLKLPVICIALVTNTLSETRRKFLEHGHVLQVAEESRRRMRLVIEAAIESFPGRLGKLENASH